MINICGDMINLRFVSLYVSWDRYLWYIDNLMNDIWWFDNVIIRYRYSASICGAGQYFNRYIDEDMMDMNLWCDYCEFS